MKAAEKERAEAEGKEYVNSLVRNCYYPIDYDGFIIYFPHHWDCININSTIIIHLFTHSIFYSCFLIHRMNFPVSLDSFLTFSIPIWPLSWTVKSKTSPVFSTVWLREMNSLVVVISLSCKVQWNSSNTWRKRYHAVPRWVLARH